MSIVHKKFGVVTLQMPRKIDHNHQEIKEIAVSVTRDLLITRGVKTVTARKVADRIGYSVGTLYNVFENVEDLIMEVARRDFTTLCSKIKLAVDVTTSPYERLQVITINIFDFGVMSKNISQVIFGTETKELPLWYKELTQDIITLCSDAFFELSPNVGKNGARSLAEAYVAIVYGMVSMYAYDKLTAISTEKPALIGELIFAMFTAGIKSICNKLGN